MGWTQIVSVRLEPSELEKIDALVKLGRFPNRSVAIRMLLKDALKKLIIKDIEQSIIESLGSPRMLSDKTLQDIGTRLFDKSTSEIVTEGRER